MYTRDVVKHDLPRSDFRDRSYTSLREIERDTVPYSAAQHSQEQAYLESLNSYMGRYFPALAQPFASASYQSGDPWQAYHAAYSVWAASRNGRSPISDQSRQSLGSGNFDIRAIETGDGDIRFIDELSGRSVKLLWRPSGYAMSGPTDMAAYVFGREMGNAGFKNMRDHRYFEDAEPPGYNQLLSIISQMAEKMGQLESRVGMSKAA